MLCFPQKALTNRTDFDFILMNTRFRCLVTLLLSTGCAPWGWAQTPPPETPPVLPAGSPSTVAGEKPVSPPAAAVDLKSRTSRVNGLLVMQLDGGKMAGATSQMNVVALPTPGLAEATLTFNQDTGPMMEKALQEVRKFHTIRHGRWPENYKIEVSFADKYTPKDGPSAAVACALLVEGLYTGNAWDEALAVTGDLNTDGSVQPVGGVPAKIRGAVGRQCRIVGVPAANERAVRDFFLTEGPHALMSINVFALKEFDQARDLAMTTRPAALTTALAEFDKIIKAAPAKEKAPAWVKMPAVAAQLRKVTAAAPHHLSARLLLEYAEGRAPAMLSLAGSIEVIESETSDVLKSINTTLKDSSLSGLKKDGLGDAVYRLKRLRTRMHPETRPLLDSMEAFSMQVRAFLASPPRSATMFNRAAQGISSAGSLVDENFKSLRANPEVMAELMKE